MNLCSSCKHWNRDRSLSFHAAPHIDRGWGICTLSEDSDGINGSPPREGSRMFAQDGSGYWAALITHPEFGCSE